MSDKQVVLVPPNIPEKMTVSYRKADEAYKKAWGLFVANLAGNVTPSNVDFINDQLSQIMDAVAYHSMKAELAGQITDIRSNNLSITFEATQIQYEPSTDKVFVIGKSQTTGTAGQLKKEPRVYELQIVINSGRPRVNELQTYTGEARTSPVMDKLEKRAIRNSELEKKAQQR